MSSLQWSELLNQSLLAATSVKRPPRLAIVGIGNELRGDDAVGVLIVRDLLQRVPKEGSIPSLLVVDAGSSPANCTGTLRRFAPEFVLLIDAAQMYERPGAVRYLVDKSVVGPSASTHSLPLSMIAEYLSAEFHCNVALLGIQPANDALSASLSSPVQRARDTVVEYLAGRLLARDPN